MDDQTLSSLGFLPATRALSFRDLRSEGKLTIRFFTESTHLWQKNAVGVFHTPSIKPKNQILIKNVKQLRKFITLYGY